MICLANEPIGNSDHYNYPMNKAVDTVRFSRVLLGRGSNSGVK